ncbi:hypothetical protein Sjap_019582 [Stephania japonica]|uniref:non-specific serine/threonine protein kinase n=1 Tax=Stephania japonica TaxID=461633 RepID=A0AAP0HUV2_9MAGN
MAKSGADQSTTGAIYLVLVLIFTGAVAFDVAKSEDEIELLISFKSSIKDPLHFLSTWNNSSTNFCSWYGISCANSSHVSSIDLSAKNISGAIPPELFHLPFITTINLSGNQLRGEIPTETFSCSSLKHLNLSNNNFTGSIPRRGFIAGLETFDLSNNMITGEIPGNIGQFAALEVLDFGGNVLSGEIPVSLWNLSNLEVLTLASNQFLGEIPSVIGRMKSLRWIYLGYNNLSGEIPKEIGYLTSLNHLDLVYNNLTGEIPSSIGNLSNLQYLFLYQNGLTGSIPRSLFDLRNLISLDLSDNYLSGEIPEVVIQLKKLEVLHLFSNNFTGRIPKALTYLPKLQVLQLWSNRLYGEIPQDLGKLSNLTVLDLSTNNLTGKIPSSLCESRRLFKLILFSNSLTGEIPRSLSYCKTLQRIRIQNNRLSGELPMDFTRLPLVYYIDVSGNRLSGRIDQREWHMPALEMLNLARNEFTGNLPVLVGSDKLENLDLSENNFSGSIPPSFGQYLSELMLLNVGQNQLTGLIPEELSSCKKLVNIDLSRNQLTGPIPAALSAMPVLGDLDLSQNLLSGEIPPNLGEVVSLVQINISHNQFHGELPSTGAFLAINASAVAGNRLCGGDAVSGLPPCNKADKPVWWFFLASLLVVLAVLALSIIFVVFIRRRRRRNKWLTNQMDSDQEANDGTIATIQFFNAKASKSITVDDILCSIKEENIIYKSHNSILYKGKSSSRNGLHLVVKLLTNISSLESNFWSEMAELGRRVRHRNVVKLMAIYRSEKGGILIHEWIDGLDLSEAVRGMSWERRRKIIFGIANAVNYLHVGCSPRVLVGELSSKKVIIDGKDEPRLRLGVPEFNIKASLFCSAYVAPELKDKNKAEMTEKSDIYGFGILVIEILTGNKDRASAKSGTVLGVHENIVDWARYCYSDCHLETWMDSTMKGHYSSSSSSSSTTKKYHQNEMVEMMGIALQCTAMDPAERPCISDVVQALDRAVQRSRSCISDKSASSAAVEDKNLEIKGLIWNYGKRAKYALVVERSEGTVWTFDRAMILTVSLSEELGGWEILKYDPKAGSMGIRVM